MGANYSYRVCERFTHRADAILRTFKNDPEIER
jgi:hypothetical protein